MKDQTAQTPAAPVKPEFRRLGGVGSIIEYKVRLTMLDTPQVEEIVKRGRIAEMTEPLKVVTIDADGRDGKTVEVAINDVIKFV